MIPVFAMLRLKANYNPQPLMRKLDARKRGFAGSLDEELPKAGRLIAVQLAQRTQPFNFGEGARKLGEQATAGDIRRVYGTPGNVFDDISEVWKASFWHAIKSHNYPRAEKLMHAHSPHFRNAQIKPFDGGAAHKNLRNSRGRIGKKQQPTFVVQTVRNLTAYVKQEVSRVGEGKAGWAACARELGGTRGIPQWVTRHIGKLASGSVHKVGSKYGKQIVSQVNEVPYADRILSPGEKAMAIKMAFQNLDQEARKAHQNVSAAFPL